ncbi:MAG: GNAT family N-acetyltransferase [Candidatus Anammoximicrobium sp.]|nr:GNAT family N-acetyltransferase [Candidatus Anammoximicrobium sp.]
MSRNHAISVYTNGDMLPAEAAEMFRNELAESLRARPDADRWRFVTVCAVDSSGHVLGGVHMDIGPMEFGPLAEERLAYLEQLLVLPQNRGQGLGTALLLRAVEESTARGCSHIRCNVSWGNPAAIAVYRRAGFALTCLEDGEYFAVKPTRAASCRA